MTGVQTCALPISSFMRSFKALGNDVRDDILTVEEAKTEIMKFLRRNDENA